MPPRRPSARKLPLGSAFSGIWNSPGLLAFGVATVSGFSERVLNRVLQEAVPAITASGGRVGVGGAGPR